MLLLLTGASGAGKSTALRLLSGGLPETVRAVEFDSIGVPTDADTSWRHQAIESWVDVALSAQDAGDHLLLCGQVPMGELLAAPSADRLHGIAVCLLDCSPATRTRRLLTRGEDPDAIVHHVRFGEWFRQHTLDPTHAPEVVRVESGFPMAWERWSGWTAGDERWAAKIIDTDPLEPDVVARAVEQWVRECLSGDRPTLPQRLG